MKITRLQLKKIIHEELGIILEVSDDHVNRLKGKFPEYSDQEIQALAQAIESLPRGGSDPQHSQDIPRVEKKPELRRLGIDERELREIEGLDQYEAGEYEMLAAKWKSPQKYGDMSAEERETLESYQSRIQQAQKGPRGGSDMTPEDTQFFTVVAMKHPSERTDAEKQKMSHLRAKYRMDVDPGFSGKPSVNVKPVEPVDPYAPTEEIPDDAPTVRTPRLYKENKKINKTEMKQMILGELMRITKRV
tara:strand:+ start:8014 stop:8754 length:741 start_codon:yes stop_codon:yes gene_type:complete